MAEKVNNNAKINCFVVVLSFIATIGLMHFFMIDMGREYLLFLILLVFLCVVLKFAFKKLNKRRMKFALIFSIPFSLALWLGNKIVFQSVEFKPFEVMDVLSLFGIVVLFIALAISVFYYIDNCNLLKVKTKEVRKKMWLYYSVAIIILWIPLFLIFFPGQVSVDSAVMIGQILGETELSNWHPVLYVLLISVPIKLGFYVFGDLTLGIALSVLLQMLLLSTIFGYVVFWCERRCHKKWITVSVLLFFALCPIVSCYAITLWKDVLFSAVFLLFIVKVYDFIVAHGRGDAFEIRDILWPTILVFLLAFLRNGGVLIVAAFGIAMFVYYRVSRKMIGILFAIAVITIVVIQGPIYGVLGIKKSPFMESMSIPAQQMAYVAYSNQLSSDEKDSLSFLADTESMAENYLPMNADPAKNSFDYDKVEDNKILFLTNWWKMLLKHFPAYVKAYILQTNSYWNVEGYSWALSYEHNHDDLWLNEDWADVPLFGSELRDFVEKSGYNLMDTSWFGWLGNVGVIVWFIVAITIVYLYQKRYKLMILMVAPVIYIISLMVASPISGSFRYVYSLLLIMPVLILICFIKSERRLK